MNHLKFLILVTVSLEEFKPAQYRLEDATPIGAPRWNTNGVDTQDAKMKLNCLPLTTDQRCCKR